MGAERLTCCSLFLSLLLLLVPGHPSHHGRATAWQQGANPSPRPTLKTFSHTVPAVTHHHHRLEDVDRREFARMFAAAFLAATASSAATAVAYAAADPQVPDAPAASAADNDLASSLFNPDGSLKEGVESEAKFRTVSISWREDATDDTNSLIRNDDGVDGKTTASGSTNNVRLSYKLPLKWATGTDVSGDALYFDRTEGVNAKACRRITVFRPSGIDIPESRLDKASTVGIAESLGVPDDLTLLRSADLISGRTVTRDGQRYYEFDLAVAPKTCDTNSKENLGLGFCPYDTIYLLSATIHNGRLYVMAIESDKAEWRRANSDLKLVRSSFAVQ